MSDTPPTHERRTEVQPQPPHGSELTACLWVMVALIAVLELAWVLFNRMYS
jgi:hypothetical protein